LTRNATVAAFITPTKAFAESERQAGIAAPPDLTAEPRSWSLVSILKNRLHMRAGAHPRPRFVTKRAEKRREPQLEIRLPALVMVGLP
jgi:hypothetical protein